MKPGLKVHLSASIDFRLQRDAALATASSETNFPRPDFNGDERDIEFGIGEHKLS